MAYISKTKTISLPYQKLFELVMDVDSYSEFLPFCTHAKVTSKTESQMEADLQISFAGMNESYSSLIIPTFNEEYGMINVTAINGPFQHLVNIWKFIPVGASETMVEFTLDFELKSFLLSKIIDVFLQDTHHKILNAFEKRAREKYGKQNISK